MLEIIFGENAGTPAATALRESLRTIPITGTLYLGYPVLSTADSRVFVDGLLISAEHGIVAFDLTSDVGNGRLTQVQEQAIRDRQDQIYASIYNKMNAHRELRSAGKLLIDFYVVTCHPNIRDISNAEGFVLSSPRTLIDLLRQFHPLPGNLYPIANAAIQRVSTLRPQKKRDDVVKKDSKGAILKRIEKEIANLDSWQNRGAIEYANGPQRIRGLAGSGKTVVLALKAAYLHSRHPEWTIAVTFNTRSLYQQFRNLIRRFMFDQAEDEPDWSKLLVLHAWGSPRDPGVYSTICNEYGVPPHDWRSANARYSSRAFEGACEELLSIIERSGNKKIFDVVLVDEAQDLPRPFFRTLYSSTPAPHRIIWAYDDLQNLGDYEMPSDRELFGNDPHGMPLVTLKNEPDQPKEDIVLPVCYRNTPWALATAHALGFGIYREEGLVQMFEEPSIWPRIGYELVGGELELGAHLRVRRRAESYPAYFLDLLRHEDAVQAQVFPSEEAQYDELAKAVSKNLKSDELEHTDILVVLPDTWTSRSVGSKVMTALLHQNISSHLAGVTTSRDEVFRQNSIAITHIHRAKGNEAPMIYIVNSEYCQSGLELSRKRNILFTGITRSRCWVRIFGVGSRMAALAGEIDRVRNANFELEFDYPDQQQIKKLARVHRDMTIEERHTWQRQMDTLKDLAKSIQDGDASIDAIPEEIRSILNKIGEDGRKKLK